MRHHPTRRAVLRTSLGCAFALALPQARACDFYSTRLHVYRPWARASGPGADFALLFMQFDEVIRSDRLIGIETPIATGAQMVRAGVASTLDLLIPAGRTTVLHETGTHLRLTGLTQPLLLGREYPLKLIFDSGVVSADIDVDFSHDERLS